MSDPKYTKEELTFMARKVLNELAQSSPAAFLVVSVVSVQTGLPQDQVITKIETLAQYQQSNT